MIEKLGMSGVFTGEVYQHVNILRALEGGDPGELAHVLRAIHGGYGHRDGGMEKIATFRAPNTVVDEYRNKVLQLGIGGGTVNTNVRMGLFSNDVTPGRTLTLATLSGTLTEFTDYTVESGNATNRAPFTGGTAASQSIDNSASPSIFTFTGTGTIRGAFVCLGATLKSGAGDATPPNILVSAGRLSADQPISAVGAIINMVYTQSNDT